MWQTYIENVTYCIKDVMIFAHNKPNKPRVQVLLDCNENRLN